MLIELAVAARSVIEPLPPPLTVQGTPSGGVSVIVEGAG